MKGNLKIFIGADHRGFELKNFLVEKIELHDYKIVDLGAYRFDPEDDYPDIALKVAREVAKSKNNRGIVLCGSGIGVCITANKVRGIRAGFGNSVEIVRKAREDDDINILAIPADFINQELALALVEVFLDTPFKNERKDIRRIEKIKRYESISSSSSILLTLSLILLIIVLLWELIFLLVSR